MIHILLALASFMVSGNFAVDLYGQPDARPYCWGYADSQEKVLTFSPPPGFRVHIARLRGDLVAWVRSPSTGALTPPGSAAGVLLAFHDSGPEGSMRCDLCADNTPVYIQDAVNAAQPKTRAPFDAMLDWVLPADNKLIVKMASWLNDTGKPIHVEATYTVTFEFVE